MWLELDCIWTCCPPQAIYDFSSELQDTKKQKRIPYFRIRLYFQMLKYKLKEFGFWEHSLREIEIQRGTLTANVFYFIRWTLFFNVVLSLIAFVGMYVPYQVIYFTWDLKVGRGACNLTMWNQCKSRQMERNFFSFVFWYCCKLKFNEILLQPTQKETSWTTHSWPTVVFLTCNRRKQMKTIWQRAPACMHIFSLQNC